MSVSLPANVGKKGAIAVAMALVVSWEGLSLTSYPDVIGVWTACYGETHGVKPGQRYSLAQCNSLLAARVAEVDAALRRCVGQPMLPGVEGALVSWAYNIGTGAACGSTLVRKLKAGDTRGACNELPRWNRAGGGVLTGLIKRRAAERQVCLEALE